MSAGGAFRGGECLTPGQVLPIEGWHRVTVEEVPNPGEIPYASNRYHRRLPKQSVSACQLTDENLGGRFPWEEGYQNAPSI